MTLQANDIQNTPMEWHKKSWDRYIAARKQQKLPHAMLITGEQGIGKSLFAERLVKTLLCTDNKTDEACGKCQSCKTYESQSNPDFLKIDLLEDKTQITVDQIRSMNDFINYSRSFDAYKVILINQVDRLNINAANSLLKNLEEPSDNTVIILISSQFSRLIATIKSRCQRLHIASPTLAQTKEWLTQNSIDTAQLSEQNLVRPLNALQIENSEIEKQESLYQDIAAIIHDEVNLIQVAKKYEKELSLADFIDWQLVLLKQLIKQKIIDVKNNKCNNINNIENDFNLNTLWKIYHEIINQKQYIHTSVNSLMFIENVLLLWKLRE